MSASLIPEFCLQCENKRIVDGKCTKCLTWYRQKAQAKRRPVMDNLWSKRAQNGSGFTRNGIRKIKRMAFSWEL